MSSTNNLKERLRRWLDSAPAATSHESEARMMKPNTLYVASLRMLIDEGRTVEFPVRGWSMRIFVEHERDKAILAPCQRENLRVGDVVLARIEAQEEIYVLHRIIKREGKHLTLMGDGNLYGTERSTTDDVVAIVTGFVRGGKTTPDMLTSRKWRIYSFFWLRLRPIRRWLILAWRLLRRLHILKR